MDIPFGMRFVAMDTSPVTPFAAAGEPVAFLRLSPFDSIATSYSWDAKNSTKSESDVRTILQTTLSKLNKDPRNVSATDVGITQDDITQDDIKAFRKWDYFPRFNSSTLKAGWYAKFNAVQGSQKTYWASGLNGLETVEWAVRAGLDVADSYF